MDLVNNTEDLLYTKQYHFLTKIQKAYPEARLLSN